MKCNVCNKEVKRSGFSHSRYTIKCETQSFVAKNGTYAERVVKGRMRRLSWMDLLIANHAGADEQCIDVVGAAQIKKHRCLMT